MTQGHLFDAKEGKLLKERALLAVAANAPSGWATTAALLVMKVAKREQEFTSDDVWKEGLEEPPEPRALGAVMGSLARAKHIEQTGRYVKTARKTRHHAPIAVWRLVVR